jgi:hypothetical protein
MKLTKNKLFNLYYPEIHPVYSYMQPSCNKNLIKSMLFSYSVNGEDRHKEGHDKETKTIFNL